MAEVFFLRPAEYHGKAQAAQTHVAMEGCRQRKDHNNGSMFQRGDEWSVLFDAQHQALNRLFLFLLVRNHSVEKIQREYHA